MKINLFSHKLTGSLLMLLLCCFLMFPSQGYGQKIYASSQTNQVNGLCLLCGVSNPGNAINSNLNDYSTFVINVGLLGVSVEQTLIFPAASNAGCDSLIVGIGSGDPVLSANLFGGVTIQTYNGSVANNDAQVTTAGILRLLDNNTRAEVLLKPTAQFDRVKVTLNSSLVGLLTSFRLYYAYHQSTIPPVPVITPSSATICSGDSLTLAVTPISGTTITWYAAGTGGSPLATGNSITVKPVVTTTYYAAATAAGCTSARTPVIVTVNPKPAQPTVNNPVTICTGDTAVLTATGPNIKWYSSASGGTLLFTGSPYRVSPAASAVYYAQADTLGCISGRAADSVIVVTKPAVPTLAADTVTICYGDSAILRAIAPAGVTFRWYYNATGGSPVISGATVILYNQPTTATFYVDAVNSNGCVSVSRKPVTVLVNPVPAIPVYTVPSPACQPVVIPITNHQNGVVYNVRIRYAGGITNPFDTTFTQTGDTIHLPVYPLDTDADIYVQTVNAVTGCKSIITHQAFTVKRRLLPPTVVQDTIIIHPGDSVNVSTTGGDIKWYDAPASGTLLYTGNPYRVAPSTTTTYYAAATGEGCESQLRTPVTVKIINCATPPSGAIAIYRFTNNLQDESGNNYNGTATTGAVTYAQDVICNQVGKFSNSFVTITSGTTAADILPTKALSVAYWVKFNSSGTFHAVVNGALQDNNADEFGWGVGHNNNTLMFFLRGANNSVGTYMYGPQTLQTNHWYHVVATYDNTTMSLYLDGVLYNSRTQQSGDIVYQHLSSDVFGIGAYKDLDEFYPINGSVDEVYIYDKALSATEISNFYNSYTPTSSSLSRVASPSVVTAKAATALVSEKRTGEKMASLSFYPNPSNGLIQIQTKEDLNGSVVIVNSLDGKAVYRDVLSTNNVHLPATLTTGIYVIQVRTKTGKIFTGKVMLKK